MAPIIEARRAKSEWQYTNLEWNEAGLDRIEAREERRAVQELRLGTHVSASPLSTALTIIH